MERVTLRKIEKANSKEELLRLARILASNVNRYLESYSYNYEPVYTGRYASLMDRVNLIWDKLIKIDPSNVMLNFDHLRMGCV